MKKRTLRRLKVSRPSIDFALSRLQRSAFVTITASNGRGTFWASLTSRSISAFSQPAVACSWPPYHPTIAPPTDATAASISAV